MARTLSMVGSLEGSLKETPLEPVDVAGMRGSSSEVSSSAPDTHCSALSPDQARQSPMAAHLAVATVANHPPTPFIAS